jgi:two-component system, sporulation sensor kinase E
MNGKISKTEGAFQLSNSYEDSVYSIKTSLPFPAEYEDKLKLLEHSIDSISEMVTITDNEDRFIFVNQAFLDRYGYTEEEVLGKTPAILSPNPQDTCPIIKGGSRWTGELLNITRSGERFFIKLETSVVKDENGKAIGNIGIAKDMTEQIEAEEKLKRSESLASLGRMTSYLSHRIKMPLTGIKLNIEALMEQMSKDNKFLDSFVFINKEIKHLEGMLNNVLQFSRQRETLQQEVSLHQILEQVVELLDPVLKKQRIRFISQVSEEQVKGDPGEIKTLFNHLIENSIEAIQMQGEIEFLSVVDLKRKMHRLFIRDTGCGIKSARKIFDPFYTTKEGGTGLGLSIVQQIVENHKGTISLIFSEPGNTIFQVSLPLS